MKSVTCQCGAQMTDSEHQVTTEKGAFKQWGIVLCVLPVKIYQRECHKCGRHGWRAFDQTGVQIAGRGW